MSSDEFLYNAQNAFEGLLSACASVTRESTHEQNLNLQKDALKKAECVTGRAGG